MALGTRPANESRGFDGKEFYIQFDEYVVLKNATENVLVSPPMKEKPEFTTKGKGVLVKLKDTLQDCDLRGRFFYRFDSERSVVSLSLVDCELNSTKNLEDFTGLTTLTLIRSGENLDWSELAALPCLKAVYCDSAMADTLQAALQGSGVSVRTVD